MAKKLKDKELLGLARKAVPGLQTLQTRNSDRLDFYEVSVGSLTEALREAYERGRSTQMDSGKLLCRERLSDIGELLKLLDAEVAALCGPSGDGLDAALAGDLGEVRATLLYSLSAISGTSEDEIETSLPVYHAGKTDCEGEQS